MYLKLQPYRQHSIFRQASHKLVARYYGPYPIMERISDVAYLLRLPESSKVQLVLHISLLKCQAGDVV